MLGEEEAEALLSQFPSRELDEPVTQSFVRAEIATVRLELHTEIGALRDELHGEIGALRDELHTEIGSVRTDLAGMEARLTERMRQQTVWFLGALIASMTLIAAFVAALR